MRSSEVFVKNSEADWLEWEFYSMNQAIQEEVIETVYEQVIVKDYLTGREMVLTKHAYEKPNDFGGFNPCSLCRDIEYIALLC